jgi:UDP-glucose 4-epimerase
MKVLVTGGAGRVGRGVVHALLERGDRVVSFDLRASGQTHAHLTDVVGVFDDPQAAARAVDGADAVLHLGAFMSWLPSEAQRVYDANVTGTYVLLDASRRAGVRKFVFASSGEVYPETRPVYLPLDEAHPTQPASLYGLTKLLGEEMVRFHQRIGSLGTVILRFSHTQDASELLDPESFFSGPRFYLRSKIRQQASFGNQRAVDALSVHDDGTPKLFVSHGEDGTVYRMPITDTRDIVEGVVRALDSDRAIGQTLNLGTEEAVRFDEAVAMLQAVIHLPVVDVRLPGAAMNYSTSRARAIEVLEHRPAWTFKRMVEDAVASRERKSS